MSRNYAALQISKIRGHIIGLGFSTDAADRILTESLDFVRAPQDQSSTLRLLAMARIEQHRDESESHAIDRLSDQIKGAIPHLIDPPQVAE